MAIKSSKRNEMPRNQKHVTNISCSCEGIQTKERKRMILQMRDKLYNKIRLHFLPYFSLEGILFEKNSIYFMKFIQLIYPNFP
jgi:hypothetical protein